MVSEKTVLNLATLKDQVYDYLQSEMRLGHLRPGAAINMDETSERLGVSKTPLRDALIRLEVEGFVTILPRRGVVVNSLSLQDIRDTYEIIGALESTAVLSASVKLGIPDYARMNALNDTMRQALEKNDFGLYYSRNVGLHDIFINASGNKKIKDTVDTLKKRLYDFPRPKDFIKEWEERSIEEHQKFINLMEQGNIREAARFIRDVHWSFDVQEKFLRKYYSIQD